MPYVRLVRSGDQLEVYEYAINSEYFGNHEPRQRKKKVRNHDLSARYRRADNVRRFKRDFIRLVRANLGGIESPALLTLTMFEIMGIKQAYSLFTLFFRDLSKITKSNFRYVAVPEFQRRGAVHFHVLIWGLSEDLIKNERNNRRIQNIWQRGFVDSIPTDGSPRLAGYLGKYMSKAMQDQRLLGQKAYTASRNVLRPLLFKAQEEFDDISDFYLEGFSPLALQDKSFDTQWLGKGRYRLYKKNI